MQDEHPNAAGGDDGEATAPEHEKIGRLLAHLDAAANEAEMEDRFGAALSELRGESETLNAFVTEVWESGRYARMAAARERRLTELTEAINDDHKRRMDAVWASISDEMLPAEVRRALADAPVGSPERQMAEHEESLMRGFFEDLADRVVSAGGEPGKITEETLRKARESLLADPDAREAAQRVADLIRFRALSEEA